MPACPIFAHDAGCSSIFIYRAYWHATRIDAINDGGVGVYGGMKHLRPLCSQIIEFGAPAYSRICAIDFNQIVCYNAQFLFHEWHIIYTSYLKDSGRDSRGSNLTTEFCVNAHPTYQVFFVYVCLHRHHHPQQSIRHSRLVHSWWVLVCVFLGRSTFLQRRTPRCLETSETDCVVKSQRKWTLIYPAAKTSNLAQIL